MGLRPSIALFLAAAGIRAAFVLGQSAFGWFNMGFVSADSRLYLELAAGLLRGEGFALGGRPTAFVTPGYPLFLAALGMVGLTAPLAIGLVQSLLDAGTAVMLARVATRVAPPRAAAWTGVIAALYPHAIFWTGYVLTETLFVFTTVLGILWTLRAIERPGLGRAFGAGLALGAGALVRPLLLSFALLVPCLILVSRRASRARHLVVALALLVGVAVPVGSWLGRNLVALGAPVVSSTESGYVFYQGNSPRATGGTRGYVDLQDFRPLAASPGLSEVELDRLYWRSALEFVRANPGELPRLVTAKLANMWRVTYAEASWRNVVVLGGGYVLLVSLAAAGCLQMLRRRPWRFELVLLAGFLALFVAQHMVITGMIRFRLPLEAVLTVFAGVGADAIGRWLGWRGRPDETPQGRALWAAAEAGSGERQRT